MKLRTEDDTTGYSRSIEVAWDDTVTPTSQNQLEAAAVSRVGNNYEINWTYHLNNDRPTKVYFTADGSSQSVPLTIVPLPAGTNSLNIISQASIDVCGEFLIAQLIGATEVGGPSLRNVPVDDCSGGGGGGPGNPPGPDASAFLTYAHHRDHLGTLRVVREDVTESAHDFHPFGVEMSAGAETSVRKYTGHARDEGSGLDYMQARYCSSAAARFLGIDPVSGGQKAPASFNRFVYVRNNVLRFIDPDGRKIRVAGTTKEKASMRAMLIRTARREGGRKALAAAVGSTKVWTFSNHAINSVAEIQSARKRQKDTELTMAKAKASGSVRVDLKAMRASDTHRSGIVTIVHEAIHIEGFEKGLTAYEVDARDDTPSAGTGLAEQAGLAVAKEKPDLSFEEAAKLVDQWLADGEQAEETDDAPPAK